MKNKNLIVLFALGCQLSGLATPLNDLTDEAIADTSKVVDLDEVVVVAQPKEPVRLRLQPVSSNVFGSEQLQQLNVRDLSQLSQYVPAFTMPAYGSRLTSSMYVRGIGSRVNSPAVGIYYDNIPLMSKAAFNKLSGYGYPSGHRLGPLFECRGGPLPSSQRQARLLCGWFLQRSEGLYQQ